MLHRQQLHCTQPNHKAAFMQAAVNGSMNLMHWEHEPHALVALSLATLLLLKLLRHIQVW
jgi:hypothetical protein